MTHEEKFLADIAACCVRHGVKVEQSDDYDYEDNLCGEHFTFQGKGIYCDIGEIMRAIAKATGDSL